MIRAIKTLTKRYQREEDGNMTIEFAIMVPAVFLIFMSTVEVGIYQMHQMFLDRGVDMAVRNVRLNTGANYDHGELRDMICEYSGFLENCDTEVSLTLKPVTIDTYGGPTGQPSDCNNTYPEISPLREFQHGGEHQMMLIVACYKFRPLFPTTGWGFAADDSGEANMFAFSGFVQEPS